MNKIPTLEQIHQAVNIYFGFEGDQIFKRSRELKYVEPRQMFHYLSSELTKSKLSKISSYVRKMNHATVLHSISQVEGYLDVDYNYRKSVQEVKEILNNIIQNQSSESYVRDWLKNNNPNLKVNDLNESVVSLLVKFKVDLEMR